MKAYNPRSIVHSVLVIGSLVVGWSVFCLTAIAADPAVPPAPIHFSHVTLTPPAGWTRSESGGWLIFTPPNVPAGQSVWLGISPGGPSDRDLTEEFGALQAASAHGMTTVKTAPADSLTDRQGLKLVAQMVALQDAAGNTHQRLYVARRNGGRFESMVFSTSDPTFLVNHAETLKSVIDSMVFDESRATIAPPQIAPPPVAPPPVARPPVVPPTMTPPAIAPLRPAVQPQPPIPAPASTTPPTNTAPAAVGTPPLPPPTAGNPAAAATLGAPVVGEKIDVRWHNIWYPATVLKVDGQKRYIRFDGFGDRWDQWATPDEVKPRGSPDPALAAITAEHPKALTYPTQLGAPAVGEVLHARDKRGGWYMGTVIKTAGDKRLITFQGFNDSDNEWVGPDAVRPLTADEAVAAATKHTLDGWYAKTETAYGGRFGFSLYYFGPNGVAYAGDPPGGVLTDFATLQKSDPKNCGEYQFVGKELTIRKTSGQTESHTCGGELMDKGVLQRAFRFEDGATINGTYSFSVTSNFGGVYAAAGGTWKFKADGTFEHGAFAGTDTTETKGTGGAAPGNGTHVGSTLTRGSYKLAGGQLNLTDAGKTETHGLFGIGTATSYYLVIDGQLFNGR